jgi:hypothetical protein
VIYELHRLPNYIVYFRVWHFSDLTALV